VLRRERGWSGRVLAERLTAAGCPTSQNMIESQEGRGSRLSAEQVVAAAAVFGLSLDELFGNGCGRCQGAPPVGFVCGACGLEAPPAEPEPVWPFSEADCPVCEPPPEPSPEFWDAMQTMIVHQGGTDAEWESYRRTFPERVEPPLREPYDSDDPCPTCGAPIVSMLMGDAVFLPCRHAFVVDDEFDGVAYNWRRGLLRLLRRRCRDCGALRGKPHEDGCDGARCLAYGTQRAQCGDGARLVVVGFYPSGSPIVWHEFDGHDCGKDVWSGRWPGVADAERLGWYAYFVPNGDPSWVPCGPDHPGARPDLNRLQVEGRWNPRLLRWEAR